MAIHIRIEDDIPMPDDAPAGGLPIWKALRAMKVGQSFVIPEKSKNYVRSQASRVKVSVVIRSVGSGSYRVWRKA